MEHGKPRREIFITSKLWAAEYGNVYSQYEEQVGNLDVTQGKTEKLILFYNFTQCHRIGTDYLDCYLIHWPQPWNQQSCSNREARAETWRQMERLLESEKVRSIGVSNFLPSHLRQLCEDCSIAPHLNQVGRFPYSCFKSFSNNQGCFSSKKIEFNPLQQGKSIVQCCREFGIVVQGYCPLAKGQALSIPQVTQIAESVKRTPAQVKANYSTLFFVSNE